MNINIFKIYLKKAPSSHHLTMRETNDILAGLDCSLFFIVSRVQSGQWLGFWPVLWPQQVKGNLALFFIYHCDCWTKPTTPFSNIQYIHEKAWFL